MTRRVRIPAGRATLPLRFHLEIASDHHMIRLPSISRRPSHLLLGLLALTTGAVAPAAADDLGDVLDLVPADAIAWAVSPSLSRINADLADLIDRANRPELAVAGRPVDVLVSQFGVAAGFDERGSLAIWSPTVEDLLDGVGVVAVPVESATRFLQANFTAEPDGGPDAYRRPDGTLLFTRTLEQHVLLSPRRDLVDGWKASDGGVDGITTAFGGPAVQDMRRADLLLRIDGDAMAKVQEVVRSEAMNRGEDVVAALPLNTTAIADRFQSAVGGAEDILVAIDADALALGVRGWTRYAAGSDVAEVARTVQKSGSPLRLLPPGPFYLAAGIDFRSFGGAAGFERIRRILGDDLPLPASIMDLGPHLDSIAFATRPSKLGVAMGGILNDASLVIATDQPEAARTAMEEGVVSLDGVQGAIERTATFERSVTQRKGGVADQITVKAEIAPENEREAGSRVGDASIELTATRLVFGPRGWLGLGKEVDGAYLVTFSRRPDVMDRTDVAATGGEGLDSDPVLSAMRSWMPANAGMQAFLDLGRLASLARQVAKLVPGAAEMIPDLAAAMPPVGFGLDLVPGDGETARIEWGLVIPSEVIGAGAGLGLSELGPGAFGPGAGSE